MSQQELVIKVLRVLDRAGIQYMVTGSLVSSLQGEPRSTHDIDIVVSINKGDIDTLITAFPQPDYYLDREAIVEAIANKSLFNLIDVNGGDKVDFWLLTNDPFDRSRFSRATIEQVFGYGMRISTPEDTILMKLKWLNLAGESHKQYLDALRVFEVQRTKLDFEYIQKWAKELEVESLLDRLKTDATNL
ncbi:MAG TPA: hypothetical protein DEO84_01015 [candidate division Zixibacteria bacterium]|nr:hypothetical protein [candidate division Zixibacteria bacterium]HBY99875.1 hypothetical protein [candidate division Zixibacteria bacterium]